MSNTTAKCALNRQNSAPQIVIVAPSGSGKTTLFNLLLCPKLIEYTMVGIGENSQTTIIPCQTCLDSRITDENSFALQLVRKDYNGDDIDMTVQKLVKARFLENDCNTEDTLDSLDEQDDFSQILEPKEASYHLAQIKNTISFEKLKDALRHILNYIAEQDFHERVKRRKNELKGKIKSLEVKKMVFDELWEEIPEHVKQPYTQWLTQIGTDILNLLEQNVDAKLLTGNVAEYNLEHDCTGGQILKTLFDPYAPYSLILEQITLACRPRQELIEIAQNKYQEKDFPLRLSVRDTMGLTQKGIDAASTKEALEIALNHKADAILFLLNLEERDDVLLECCKALAEKKKELAQKNHLNPIVYVVFTKADRMVENSINRLNTGNLYISEDTCRNHIHSVLDTLETKVRQCADKLPQEEVTWLALRYLKESYILKALEGDNRRQKFEPTGLFEKIVEYTLKTLRSTLPTGIEKPVFVTAKDANLPALQVVVDPEKLQNKIRDIQWELCENKSIVNGYIISDKTPHIHGRSVSTYWNKLQDGLGHTTHASVYGNFSINMKGLLRRVVTSILGSYATLNESGAVQLTAENLDDSSLRDIVQHLLGKGDPQNMIDREHALERLYEFYGTYFTEENRFALIVDRVCYNLSYGNKDVKRYLRDIYNVCPGRDSTMRKLQASFKELFKSDNFVNILIFELNQTMSEMVNKSFIVI